MIDPNLSIGILSVACGILALVVAVLAGTVPFLYWKMFRADAELREMRKNVETLDTALADLMETFTKRG